MKCRWTFPRVFLAVVLSPVFLSLGSFLLPAIFLIPSEEVRIVPLDGNFFERWLGPTIWVSVVGSVFQIPVAIVTQVPLLWFQSKFGSMALKSHLIYNAVLGPAVALLFFHKLKSHGVFEYWIRQPGVAVNVMMMGFGGALFCGFWWFYVIVEKKVSNV